MRNKNTIKSINKKVIISGNVIEIFSYENAYLKGYENTSSKKGRACSIDTDEQTKSVNRDKTLNRARSRVRRLANANPQLTKFITLTFADNITDLKIANKKFCDFIKRLNYYSQNAYLTNKVEYIAVVEFQKRGAIHYHMLCNLPYIPAKQLEKIWKNGFVKINKIDSVDNIGAYVTKYMTKDHNDTRLVGNRSYFTSQGLNEPVEIYNESIEINKNSLAREPYKTTFHNEQLGNIEYTQYVLKTASDYIFISMPYDLNNALATSS